MIAKAVVIALEKAGVFFFAHQRCADGWFENTGRELEATDVDAWTEYVREQNAQRIRTLSSGFIVFSLTQGFEAPEKCYFTVRLAEDIRAFIIS